MSKNNIRLTILPAFAVLMLYGGNSIDVFASTSLEDKDSDDNRTRMLGLSNNTNSTNNRTAIVTSNNATQMAMQQAKDIMTHVTDNVADIASNASTVNTHMESINLEHMIVLQIAVLMT